jgi:hypothetical protein
MQFRPITPFLVALLLIMACLAKESAVVFSTIVTVVALMPPGVQLFRRLSISLGAALVTISIVVIQLSFERIIESPIDNLIFAAHGGERILHALYVIGRGISMCFVPVGMSPFHDYAAIDLSFATLLPYAIPGAMFLCIGVGAMWLSLKKRSTIGFIGIGLLLGPILMNSNPFVPMATELAERLLYPASVAASAMVAWFVYRAIHRCRLRQVVLVLLVLLFSIQSWSAQRPWRNELDLYAYGTETEPLSARLHRFYGISLLSSRQFHAAAWHFMVTRYIMSKFPNRVDPAPLMQLEQLPMEERIMEAPIRLDPEDPCRFLDRSFQFLKSKTPRLEQYMFDLLSRRYPMCAASRENPENLQVVR